MNLYKAEAIILRARKYDEADSIVTMLSRYHGKIQALAKGVRKPKSRKRGGVQLFTHANFLLRSGRSLDQIDQCETIASFGKLWGDLDRLGYATYIIELVDAFTVEGESNEEVFLLLVTALHFLEIEDPMMVTRFFEVRLMQLLGYEPQLDRCSHCGGRPDVHIKFSATQGGVLCSKCFPTDPFAIRCHQGHVAVIRQLSKINLAKLGILKLSPDCMQELDKIFRAYISHHLEKRVKSWEFLRHVREFKPEDS